MEISASMVKELRESTGAGMMDCKKALQEANGDMEKAVDILREKGLGKAAKKADRLASEGLVSVVVSDDNKTGTHYTTSHSGYKAVKQHQNQAS